MFFRAHKILNPSLECSAETSSLRAITIFSHSSISDLIGDETLLHTEIPPLFSRSKLARYSLHCFLSSNGTNDRCNGLKLSTTSEGKFTSWTDFNIRVETLDNLDKIIGIVFIVRFWQCAVLVGKEVERSKKIILNTLVCLV